MPRTDKVIYLNLLEELACSTESKLDMLHRFENCPGTSTLQHYIESKHEKNMHYNDENVKFKQSISTCTNQVTIEEQLCHYLIFGYLNSRNRYADYTSLGSKNQSI